MSSFRSKMLLSTVIFCVVAIYLSSAKSDWTDLMSSESDNEGLLIYLFVNTAKSV